jgi:ABC-2 type transport system permease protein
MMRKLWYVAWHEYSRNVFKRSFILVLLSVPLLIGGNIGFIAFMVSRENNYAPVGYVDHAGLLADPNPAPLGPSEETVTFLPFQTEEEARHALDSQTIQAYYVVAPDYFETSGIELVYLKEPGNNVNKQFYEFVQINLLADEPPERALRAAAGSDITVRTPDGRRQFHGGPTLGAAAPVMLSIAFIILLLMSSGYLMQAVVEERENRTMEVLATSLSPAKLLGGKILGIVAIGLTQLAAWVIVAILAVLLGGTFLGIEWLQNPSLDWGPIFSVVAIAIPSYVLASALMLTVGSTVAQSQEGQQIGMLFFMLFIIPLYALMLIGETPSSAPSVLLTLLPFTSLLTVGFRSLFSVVPLWQVAASAAIQTACALGAVWLAGRAFRLGMLRYGQRLRLGEILGKARVAATEGSRS